MFCWVCFAVAAVWIWTEMLHDTRNLETVLPVNVVLLAVLGGIIGLVLSGFTAWHISLAIRGLTTIECLEKTRYVSPLRKALDRNQFESFLGPHPEPGQDPESLRHRLQDYGHQILDAHANAIPGVTRAEEGEERASPSPPQYAHIPAPGPEGRMDNRSPAQQALSRSYMELERQRERERYHDYLDEVDNEKMPNAFDLGWRRNLLHLFGERPLFWAVPVCNTTGDGWQWEPSVKFLEARERVRQRAEQGQAEQQQFYRDLYQRNMSNGPTWMGGATAVARPMNVPPGSGRDPERPATGVSMKTLAPMSPRPRPGDSDFEDETDDNIPLRFNRTSRSPERRNADLRRSDHHGGSGRTQMSPNGNRNLPRRKARTSVEMKGRGGESDEWRAWE